jgi:hypothetical protein
MFRVKICGITNWPDAQRAIEAGCDALGFNFYPRSPRYITPQAAAAIRSRLPKEIAAVGVFVNESPAVVAELARTLHLDYAQLHGEERPAAARDRAGCSSAGRFRANREAFRPHPAFSFERHGSAICHHNISRKAGYAPSAGSGMALGDCGRQGNSAEPLDGASFRVGVIVTDLALVCYRAAKSG